MAWLPSHQEIRDHPKTRRLTVMLDVPRAQVIGHLHCLWWWALTYADDGDLTKFDALDIALAAEWEGDPQTFVDALLACGGGGGNGFLELQGDDGLLLHDWDEYGGKYVEKRRREADRLREYRQSSASRTDDVRSTDPVPTANVGGKSREEKSREEERPASADAERREDVDSLCDVLVELVVATGARKPSVTKQWRDEARKLLDRDGVERGEAERVMRWALADDFWRANVLSMPKFRQKFDQLKLQQGRHLRAVGEQTRYNTADDWNNTIGNLSRPLDEFLRENP